MNWRNLLDALVTTTNGGFITDAGGRRCICGQACAIAGESPEEAGGRWDRRKHAPDCPYRMAAEALMRESADPLPLPVDEYPARPFSLPSLAGDK